MIKSIYYFWHILSICLGMDKKINKKINYRRIITLSIFSLSFFTLLGSYLLGETKNVFEIDKSTLKTYTIKKGDFKEYINVKASVVPIKTFYLDAVEGGTIQEILVEDGDIIDSGQVILRLENANLLMDIMYREAEFYEQQNNLRNTKLSFQQNKLKLKNDLLEFRYQLENNRIIFERNKKLFEKGHVSIEEFQNSKNTYEYMKNKLELTIENQKMDSVYRSTQIKQLELSLNRMESNLDFVKSKLENLYVKSPIRGQLTSLNGEIGESKNQGSRLGQVDVVDKFKLQAPIDEYYINQVQIGQQGKINIDDVEYYVEIKKIYPQVSGGSFNVDFEINNIPDLRRGQSVTLNLELSDSKESLLISRSGFYNETAGKWIFKIDGDKAIKQEIKIGRQNPKYFELIDGLNEGDKVIISSYSSIKDFDEINFN